MSSATGLPEPPPRGDGDNEFEPLLGRPGDAQQEPGEFIARNLIIGTGIIAQFGAVIFVAMIWAAVLTKDVILFSGHPLAQSLAIFTLTQSILSLQPTHTPEQKRVGQRVHAGLNLLAFLFLVAGVGIIEYNKYLQGPDSHFHSVHGYLGVTVSIILLLQYIVGFTMWATPKLYGGEDTAKSIWKYHRWSGYVVLVLLLVTAATAIDTGFNYNVLKLKLWAVVVTSLLILVGIIPRVQKQKLGFSS
ncbi:cytochrome b561 [Colletotrichum paranaense]|uniref:Cytochrome b561 n=5 Tax=Colletotrichum acutatum species complex TaxID=2707335 RepID=A0A135SKG9_9PEZI|nr:cytochrome b561 [Colletotrichum paranaense]XP_060381433.1 cytochrome b561 [Colletotrichum tamarilloi]KAI3536180.1 cytochrome b561 [Colletotrichum filicis]KAK0374012.1 cytochrome b561 [Colletotrichum limetticola]KAK1459145.1 cytochrome b561 [Colletotrichum melonis]KXH36365.1 cytochrome b561 [Colletotrichum nymphaeae SA-01]KAK1497293.1 cytochrome b561 [Colletotrichum tamarilloi]